MTIRARGVSPIPSRHCYDSRGAPHRACHRPSDPAISRVRSSFSPPRISSSRWIARGAAEVTALLKGEAVLKDQTIQLQVSGAAATGGVELILSAQTLAPPSSPKPQRTAPPRHGDRPLAWPRRSLHARLPRRCGLLQRRAPCTAPLRGPRCSRGSLWARGGRRTIRWWCPVIESLSPTVESYQSLRSSPQFTRQADELHTLLVTNPAASEGKTTLANPRYGARAAGRAPARGLLRPVAP